MLTTILFSAFLYHTITTALVLPHDDAMIGVVKLAVKKQEDPTGKNVARDSPVIAPLTGRDAGNGCYTVNVGIGDPPQYVDLILDTGSSITWIDPLCRNSVASTPADCEKYPRYNQSLSSTSENTDFPIKITYGTGEASGFFITDDLILGDVKISKQHLGLANFTTFLDRGIMGMAFGGGRFSTVLEEMVNQKVISSPAFSLDLGSIDANRGSLIMGGIDTRKYSGTLGKVPILDPVYGLHGYWVDLTAINMTEPAIQSRSLVKISPAQRVLLDSGSTFSLLPVRIAKTIGEAMSGIMSVDMFHTQQFCFGDTTINVPLRQFIRRLGDSDCVSGVIGTWDDMWVLGDTFLQSAFAVFDQANKMIHLANHAKCGENLVLIGSGSDAVPSLTGDCTPTAIILDQGITSQTDMRETTATDALPLKKHERHLLN